LNRFRKKKLIGGLTQAYWCDNAGLRPIASRRNRRRSSRNSDHPQNQFSHDFLLAFECANHRAVGQGVIAIGLGCDGVARLRVVNKMPAVLPGIGVIRTPSANLHWRTVIRRRLYRLDCTKVQECCTNV
jgi:hypothetical protein